MDTLVPEAVTQLAIAHGVNINYSHVPRAVKRLKKQGLLLEIMAHVETQPTSRRRKAYFLTEAGISAAQKLQALLGEHNVIFKDKNGNISEIPLASINKFLKTRLELLNLFNFLNSDDVFDQREWEASQRSKSASKLDIQPERRTIDKVKEPVEKLDLKDKKEKIEISKLKGEFEKLIYPRKLPDSFHQTFDSPILVPANKFPVVERFQNREENIDVILEAINSLEPQIILVLGCAGVGKSALVANTISDLEFSDTYIYWCNVSNLNSINDIISTLVRLFTGEEVSEVSYTVKDVSTISDDSFEKKQLENIEEQRIQFSQVMEKLGKNKTILILDGLEIADSILEVAITDAFGTASGLADAEKQITTKFDDFILWLVNTIKKPMKLKIIVTTRNKPQTKILSQIVKTNNGKNLITIELDGLDVKYVKKILGSKFNTEEVEAIFKHTDGNPMIINFIANINHSKHTNLQDLSPDERALALCALARAKLDREATKDKY